VATAGRKALWWAGDYAWAGLAWLATVAAPADPAIYAEGSKRPVVIVPGVYENWQFVRPLIEALHAAGHPVHVVPELGHNRRPLAAGAALLLDHLRTHRLTDVILVGHSKGGLVGKLAMLRDSEGRIRHLVTICSPHHGSSRATLLPLGSIRGLTPADELIRSLKAQQAANEQITSISVSYDEQVPEGSYLTGARNVMLPQPGHFRVLGHPATLARIVAEVGAVT
jgi:pimeloyl-ACP methyl ester carboxylesterase